MTAPTIGEILGAALAAPVDPEWEAAWAFAASVADHYKLPLDEVELAVGEIEAEIYEANGVAGFGHLLRAPQGIAHLGHRVCEKLLDTETANDRPLIVLRYH